MLIRQTLNFATHFVAGLAVGALVVAAMAGCANAACRRRSDTEAPLDAPRPVPPEPRPAAND